ncbi:MAG: hypothetical protein ACI35O_06870 [Bacillaceae bacterium]
MIKSINEGKVIMAHKEAIEKQMNYAATAQNDASNTSTGKLAIDRYKLAVLIREANEIIEDDLDYTNESIEVFLAAFEDANDVCKDVDATQEKADKVAKNLKTAIMELVKVSTTPINKKQEIEHKPRMDNKLGNQNDAINASKEKVGKLAINRNKLAVLIREANEIIEDDLDYTNESIEVFLVAFEDANDVCKDVDATQEKVDEVAKNLESAIKELVKLSTTATNQKQEMEQKLRTDNNLQKRMNKENKGVKANTLIAFSEVAMLFGLIGVRK